MLKLPSRRRHFSIYSMAVGKEGIGICYCMIYLPSATGVQFVDYSHLVEILVRSQDP